jgi:effector-binding domain-containing protein
LKKVGFISLLLFFTFVVTGYLLPTHAHVERSISIDRPADMLFSMLNGYQDFKQWSPWVTRDPNAEFVITGPDSGVGARLSWLGTPNLVGSGWQEIVASKPYRQIDIRLDFDSQGVASTRYVIESLGDATMITWSFDSNLTEGLNFFDGFLARYFGLLFDRWIGRDYEQGLANLKQYAESLPVSGLSDQEISKLEVSGQHILFISIDRGLQTADAATALTLAYEEISAYMYTSAIPMAGQPMAITLGNDEDSINFIAAIPVKSVPEMLSGRVQTGTSPSGMAVRAIHQGAFDQMTATYEKLSAYMTAHGLRHGGVSWEHYVSDPGETEVEDLVTHIYILLDESGESQITNVQ